MKKREKRCEQLNTEERATIMLMRQEGSGLRAIGRFLKRGPSTISRELARNPDSKSGYIASQAGIQASRLRTKPRNALKLVMGSACALFEIVVSYLKKNWSPEQIASTLQRMYPDNPQQRVSRGTIYHTLYAIPRGELRRELIACLR